MLHGFLHVSPRNFQEVFPVRAVRRNCSFLISRPIASLRTCARVPRLPSPPSPRAGTRSSRCFRQHVQRSHTDRAVCRAAPGLCPLAVRPSGARPGSGSRRVPQLGTVRCHRARLLRRASRAAAAQPGDAAQRCYPAAARGVSYGRSLLCTDFPFAEETRFLSELPCK